MQALSSTLRSQLERTVIAARDIAEEGAWAALERLAVGKAEPLSHMTPEQRDLRVKLRAKGRQLGDKRKKKNGEQDIYYLHRECAYEYWHQMLFARFLAENQLLMHPDGVALTLEECEELAAEEGTDGWTLAARYASRMLPQIFRPDDPLLGVTFAPEDMQALEKLLTRLPVEVFTADDSLGWVYQFWQTKRKKEVNDSGKKIGADELPAVTQLFTEDYMVKFLLHNTLGAWWAGKELNTEDTEGTETEEELRQKVALPGVDWEYLRFVRGADGKGGPWRPAAGTFDGWPKQAAELKIMDPCCGSGHFLVAALDLMVRILMEEEGLGAAKACDAVLRANLFGLEIDQRCTQIAAFALAFAAWTFPDAGGYRALPELHIACTGIAPQATEEQWIKLAEQSGIPMPPGGREPIRNGLFNLHSLFSQAPMLGSLINPNELPADLIAADYETLQPYLTAALTAEHADEETHERAVAAQGIVKAAELLAGEYTLAVTNVPYLTRNKQHEVLKDFCESDHKDAKHELATCFVDRCLRFCAAGSTAALVTPQNWLFLGSYRKLRERLLRTSELDLVVLLGPAAFRDMNWWAANTQLLALTCRRPAQEHRFAGIDVSDNRDPQQKAELLPRQTSKCVLQAAQLKNPDCRIGLEDAIEGPLLAEYAEALQGISTADLPRFGRLFWEFPQLMRGWEYQQGSAATTTPYGGREQVLWMDALHASARELGAAIRGKQAWGKQGVAVRQMRHLPATIATGECFDTNVAFILPNTPALLPAIWSFCSSEDYVRAVRKIDQKTNVTNATLVKVPFDFEYWQAVSEGEFPTGLPSPESEDPTQWVFHGNLSPSSNLLQVAVARLLGHRWPAEVDSSLDLSDRAREQVNRCGDLLALADADGIVCIPAVAGERTAADRLQSLLSACGIKPAENLDDWLREDFFVEHGQLFHQRPFIWHIWDGRRKDGFHALINYHKLDRKLLEKLIYTHVGDWIARQKAAESRGESGAEGRRQDAEKLQDRLKLILAGEPPYDIFVRWKPLEEQPIGWDPDLNDGVRINIRPFVTAGVLRKNPKIKWKKDRGKEPERPREQYPWFWGWDEHTDDFMGGPEFDGNRWNDCHYSNEVKRAAQAAKQESKRQK